MSTYRTGRAGKIGSHDYAHGVLFNPATLSGTKQERESKMGSLLRSGWIILVEEDEPKAAQSKKTPTKKATPKKAKPKAKE